jgi:hypothetical protein
VAFIRPNSIKGSPPKNVTVHWPFELFARKSMAPRATSGSMLIPLPVPA